MLKTYKMSVSESFNNQNERKMNEYLSKRRTFAVANKLQRRVKAAAQHSSSELGSAFTLHFTCTPIGGLGISNN